VWKAIYYHYLPVAVEVDAPPSREQLGKAAVTWAAVSLADKLDTIVGLFRSGEKPTGSRDPYGLRRAAHGIVKTLVDLEPITGIGARPSLRNLLGPAGLKELEAGQTDSERFAFQSFLMDRVRHLMQTRGLEYEEIQATTGDVVKALDVNPADLVDRAKALKQKRHSDEFRAVAEAYKRANNIVEAEWAGIDTSTRWGRHAERLAEPAELRLKQALGRLAHEIEGALAQRQPVRALSAIGVIQPELAAFFAEVRVMNNDPLLQEARLSLLAELRDRIRVVGDISHLVPKQA
jgi:glycyl-tRNA synthetase beta chain